MRFSILDWLIFLGFIVRRLGMNFGSLGEPKPTRVAD